MGHRRRGFWWGKLRALKPLGRPRGKWENNFRMDLYEITYDGVDCFDMS